MAHAPALGARRWRAGSTEHRVRLCGIFISVVSCFEVRLQTCIPARSIELACPSYLVIVCLFMRRVGRFGEYWGASGARL